MYSGVRSFNATLYDRTSQQLNPTVPIPIRIINSDTYRLQESDFGCKLLFSSSSAVTIYIGKNIIASKNIGQIIICKQIGAGQLSFSGDTGVTVISPDSNTKSRVQYSTVAVVVEPFDGGQRVALEGDLTA